VLLFVASFLLYSLASPGNLPADTEQRWSVSRQILRNGSIALEKTHQTRNYVVGVDGKRYMLSGLGQSLCLLPFVGVGLVLEKATTVGPDVSDLVAQFLASVILFPAVGAALVWLFYRLVLLLGYDNKVAMSSAAVFAFATMNFHYSVSTQEQTQVALLLVLAILLMVKHYQQQRFVYAWLFCVALGLCLVFRPASVVMVFPLYLTAAATEVFDSEKKTLSETVGKWFFAGLLGTAGFIIVCAWYNYARFGNIFESGYGPSTATSLGGHKLFESAPLPTLAAMLFSPGNSIFLYNPVLILLPICIRSFYRRHRSVALTIAVAIIGNFVFYSFFTAWAGGYSWSIRYQAAVLPFLILPLAELFSRSLKAFAKAALISVIVVSGVIQLTSVVYNFNLEFVQNPNHCIVPDSYVWDWSQSHLRKRFENIIRHIADKRDFSSVGVKAEEPMLLKYNHSEESVRKAYCVNFFPFKAKTMLPSTKLFYPLLCLWLVLLAGFCVAMLQLVRFSTGRSQKIVP
jgi:hypothetical protein